MNRNNYVPQRKLVSNTVVFFIGSLGSKVIMYFLMPIYTLYLSTSDYAVVDLYTSAMELVIPLFSFRIASANFRFSMEKSVPRNSILSTSTIFIILSSAPVIILYSIIQVHYKLAVSPFLLMLLYICMALQEVFSHFLKVLGRNALFSINSVLMAIVNFASSYYFLALRHETVNGYFYGLIAAYTFSIVFCFIQGNIWTNLGITYFDKKILRQMIGYSGPLVPSALSRWVVQAVDKYMVLFFLGSSVAGIYSASYKIPNICGAFVNIFIQAWEISAIQNIGNKTLFSSILRRFQLMVFAGSSVLMWLSWYLSDFLYKGDFIQAYRYVPLLIVAYVFSYLQAFMECVYVAVKDTKGLMATSIIGAIVNVALNFSLIPTLGVYGAILATGISFFLVFGFRFNTAYKRGVMDKVDVRLFIDFILLCLQAVLCLNSNKGVSLGALAIMLLICIPKIKPIYFDLIKLLKGEREK